MILAEDHTLVREGTRRILEATNTVSVVAEAADGQQAVEVVDRYEPDVAIIDIGMPGINGIEATRRIKQGHPRVSTKKSTNHDVINAPCKWSSHGSGGLPKTTLRK